MTPQHNLLVQLQSEELSLGHLVNPSVQKVLISRAVVDFVIAYGQATTVHSQQIRAAWKQRYDQSIAESLAPEQANKAALLAQFNEYLAVVLPPLPGHQTQLSDAEAVVCNSPSPQEIQLSPLDDQEQQS